VLRTYEAYNLTRAWLSRAILTYAHMEDADLVEAHLDGAQLLKAHLSVLPWVRTGRDCRLAVGRC
jgi:hypothetical protein